MVEMIGLPVWAAYFAYVSVKMAVGSVIGPVDLVLCFGAALVSIYAEKRSQQVVKEMQAERKGMVEVMKKSREAMDQLNDQVKKLKAEKNDQERLLFLQNRYLSNVEHRLINPVQSLVFIIEELTACTLRDNDRDTVGDLSPKIDDTGEENETVEMKDQPDSRDETDGANAELENLIDMALTAVDGIFAACGDIRDTFGLELTSAMQPTSVPWTIERCKNFLDIFRRFLTTSVDGNYPPNSEPLSPKNLDDLSSDEQVEIKFDIVNDRISACMTDPNLLFSILTRFVGNALRFTESGSVDVTVSLTDRPDCPWKRFLHVSVADTGVGVDETIENNLFKLSTPGDDKYYGLGLFLAKRKLDVLGGYCGYEPRKNGHGSIFWFQIPYVPTQLEPTSRAPPRVVRSSIQQQTNHRSRFITMDSLPVFDKPGQINSNRRRNILVIEDEEIQRTLLCKMLKSQGCTAYEATDGIQGLRMMKEREFDLVLCDKVMPGMNGDRCVKEFRDWEDISGRKKRLFICGLSANHETKLPTGFDMYLSKPLRRNELARLLKVNSSD